MSDEAVKLARTVVDRWDDVTAMPVDVAQELARAVLAQHDELRFLRRAATGCPCHHTTPCSDMCSCAHPLMSGGCGRCALYGSAEQQRIKAEHLASQHDELTKMRALLEDAQECIADRGQLIADRMQLRAALGEALDEWHRWCVRRDLDEDDPSFARIAELRKLVTP